MIKMTTLEFTSHWQETLEKIYQDDPEKEITIPIRDIQYFVNCTKVAIEQGLVEDKEIDVYFGSKKNDRN